MKYTTVAAAAATTSLVSAAGAYRHGGSETAWTPATQTQPPVAGFTLRPTLALRMPRAGLLIREDDDDDDDDDEDGRGRITHGTVTATSTLAGSGSGSVTSAPRPSNTCGWDRNGAASLRPQHATHGSFQRRRLAVRKHTRCSAAPTNPAPARSSPQTRPAPAPVPAPAAAAAAADGKSNTGAIVGGVIGGILALLLVLFFRQRRRGKAKHVVADRSLRDSTMSHASWAGEHDSRGGGGAVEKSYEAVPRRKPVPGSETQDSGYTATTSPATTTTMTTDRGSPNEHLAYSVSSASGTMGSQGGMGVVSSLSTAAPPPPLAGVVEAPDTGVPQDSAAAPVEVAGTTVTRETMQNRAELP
ncbi:hypothetical protein BBAD15_g10529 [Beauveria bassiana D1-5]|uniref:Uncharacterized protein n=1 Tax=Beauveria bassiana D1-5 TaxID=1245745 RepID=A0A0A2VDS7_BEABA|nr:hypothetical protein BBAD15_g10529 [Beauveria bassiana D1-5]